LSDGFVVKLTYQWLIKAACKTVLKEAFRDLLEFFGVPRVMGYADQQVVTRAVVWIFQAPTDSE
jgi:hypothetical protein